MALAQEEGEIMKDLVEFIARSLVDRPDKVRVRSFRRRSEEILELRVDPEDTGRVIGKGGQVASAIRSVLKAAAAKQGRRDVTLKIR